MTRLMATVSSVEETAGSSASHSKKTRMTASETAP
jgi:hypothetical protein